MGRSPTDQMASDLLEALAKYPSPVRAGPGKYVPAFGFAVETYGRDVQGTPEEEVVIEAFAATVRRAIERGRKLAEAAYASGRVFVAEAAEVAHELYAGVAILGPRSLEQLRDPSKRPHRATCETAVAVAELVFGFVERGGRV